jgi:putative Mg2+ transporter-C (MgtC) family protein
VRLEEGRDLSLRREDAGDLADTEGVDIELSGGKEPVTLVMQVKGKRPVSDLIASLSDIGGVHEIGAVDADLVLD